MKEGIKKYIELELAPLTREERRNSVENQILEIEKEGWNFDDVSQLITETEKKIVYIRQPLFEKIIYPILKNEISLKNVEAIKILIKLKWNFYAHQRKFNISEFDTVWQLVEEGLKIKENDRELLEIYEDEIAYSLNFSIHEVPWGVLSGMDVANISQCDELQKTLETYKDVCKKLSLENDEDRKDLIENCDFHYRNYKTFLQNSDRYKDYADFLKKND